MRDDGFANNSFRIRRFPEEALTNKNDPTFHKYGVLTYVGPVDKSRGIDLAFVAGDVLRDRFSYPSKGVAPAPANFSGKTDVYAVHPALVVGSSERQNELTLARPDAYTYMVGVIEQKEVPNGVVNITTENHKVYPGTIRRTAMDVDGHLFIYTSGTGVNRLENSGNGPGLLLVPAVGPILATVRAGAQSEAARSNDILGAMAFRTLDQQALKYIQSKRGK